MSVLFVGSFLSRKTGTIGISEKLMGKLSSRIKISASSSQMNQLLRLFEILVKVQFASYRILHIDVFSGRAFIIAELASFFGRIRGKRIVLNLRGGNLSSFISDNEKRVKRVLARADHILTPSRMLQHAVNKKMNVSVQYLPNFIELSSFPYNRNEVKPYSMLWVRAFAPIYNPEVAIKILYEIKKNYAEASLTMIGPDKGKLKEVVKLIGSLGLKDSVTIMGPVPNVDLYSFYQSHHVYLNTTSFESFGVAVLEAVCCGIPVVSHNVGEIPYLWKHEEDMLLTSLRVEEMQFQVKRIFDSPQLDLKISGNARKKAEQFAWENICPHWLSLLDG